MSKDSLLNVEMSSKNMQERNYILTHITSKILLIEYHDRMVNESIDRRMWDQLFFILFFNLHSLNKEKLINYIVKSVFVTRK